MKFFESLTTEEVIAYFREKAAGEIPHDKFELWKWTIPDLAIGLIDAEFGYNQSRMPFSVRAARHQLDKEGQRMKALLFRG